MNMNKFLPMDKLNLELIETKVVWKQLNVIKMENGKMYGNLRNLILIWKNMKKKI